MVKFYYPWLHKYSNGSTTTAKNFEHGFGYSVHRGVGPKLEVVRQNFMVLSLGNFYQQNGSCQSQLMLGRSGACPQENVEF